MRKEKSWIQREYEQVYQWLRRGVGIDWLLEHSHFQRSAIRNADYSYQAYGYEMSGWTSRIRRSRFLYVKSSRNQQEELPF